MLHFFFFIFLFSVEWDFFHWEKARPCDKKICLGKDEVIEKTLRHSLENKMKFESVFRSWQNIRIQWGRILPHINFDTIAGCGLGGFFVGNQADAATQLYSNFLGFLYPSRWFRWKEAKMQYQAEKLSYYSLKAYSVNIAENMYYEIHREMMNKNILDHYFEIINNIIEIMQERFYLGLCSKDELLQLKVKKQILLSQKSAIEQNLQQSLYALLTHMSYDPKVDWSQISLNQLFLEIPKTRLNPEEFKEEVLQKSYEIKAFDYLYKASRFAFKAKKWDFISPMSDEATAIGFSRSAILKTSNSYSRTINLEKENIKVKTIQSLYNITNFYNFSLLILNNTQKAFNKLNTLRTYYLQDLEDTNHLDVPNWMNLFEQLLEFDLAKNTILHGNYIAQSNFDRLRLKGFFYDSIPKDKKE